MLGIRQLLHAQIIMVRLEAGWRFGAGTSDVFQNRGFVTPDCIVIDQPKMKITHHAEPFNVPR
jgi:hypothetical protein